MVSPYSKITDVVNRLLTFIISLGSRDSKLIRDERKNRLGFHKQRATMGRRTKMKNNPRETEATTYSNSIPIDLLFEILLRLPAKSVTRFVSVSKLFAKIIRSQDFIRFSFRSSKQKQRVLLAFSGVDKEEGRENWFFLSSSLEDSSSSVFLSTKACHAPELRYTRPSCVHGLISFVYGQEQIICNPATGKSITLPLVKSRRSILKRFFGYI